MTKQTKFIDLLLKNQLNFTFESSESRVHINHLSLAIPGIYSEIDVCVSEKSTFYRVDMRKPFLTQGITHSAVAVMNAMQDFVSDRIDAFFDPIAITAAQHYKSSDPESILAGAESFLDALNAHLEEAVDFVDKQVAMARHNLLEPLQ